MKKPHVNNWLCLIAGILFCIWGARGLILQEIRVKGGGTYSLNTDPVDFWAFIAIHFIIGVLLVFYAFRDQKKRSGSNE